MGVVVRMSEFFMDPPLIDRNNGQGTDSKQCTTYFLLKLHSTVLSQISTFIFCFFILWLLLLCQNFGQQI